jgi:hypothetical protein
MVERYLPIVAHQLLLEDAMRLHESAQRATLGSVVQVVVEPAGF